MKKIIQMMVTFAAMTIMDVSYAEISRSTNFTLRADGVASAELLRSNNFSLFSVVGDGRVVGESRSNNFALSSSFVFTIAGRPTEINEVDFCFPIKARNGAIVVICL